MKNILTHFHMINIPLKVFIQFLDYIIYFFHIALENFELVIF